MNIKQKVVNDIIAANLVKPYYVVNHSYTDGGGERFIKNHYFHQRNYALLNY